MVDLKALDVNLGSENEKKAVAESAANFLEKLNEMLSGSKLGEWISQVKKVITDLASEFNLFKKSFSDDVAKLKDETKKLQDANKDLETKLTSERAFITQVSQAERKNISENSKLESDKIQQLEKKATAEMERILNIFKEERAKQNQELEKFRVEHIAIIEKRLAVLENNVAGAAELLKRKE